MKAAQYSFCKTLFTLLLVYSVSAYAAWGDLLDIFKETVTDTELTTTKSLLSNKDVIAGLKEALTKGSQVAVSSLGQKDGFLDNPRVKIPMPESLQKVESGLRAMKQDKMADEFIETMNRAAETAVPKTFDIFRNAISNITIADARGILQGGNTAATDYFRKKSSSELSNAILPIVEQATEKTGVTQQYKKLFEQLGFMSRFIDMDSLDLDQYVTTKTMDGLFLMVEEQEKLIRENPAARTTEILKKVFSSQTGMR